MRCSLRRRVQTRRSLVDTVENLHLHRPRCTRRRCLGQRRVGKAVDIFLLEVYLRVYAAGTENERLRLAGKRWESEAIYRSDSICLRNHARSGHPRRTQTVVVQCRSARHSAVPFEHLPGSQELISALHELTFGNRRASFHGLICRPSHWQSESGCTPLLRVRRTCGRVLVGIQIRGDVRPAHHTLRAALTPCAQPWPPRAIVRRPHLERRDLIFGGSLLHPRIAGGRGGVRRPRSKPPVQQPSPLQASPSVGNGGNPWALCLLRTYPPSPVL